MLVARSIAALVGAGAIMSDSDRSAGGRKRDVPSATPANAGYRPGYRPTDLAKNLVLLGLVGLLDPPRKEAIEAVKECHGGGIRVTMITGNHKITAAAIARMLGIGAVVVLQLLFTDAPPLQVLFDNQAIRLRIWLWLFVGGLAFFLVVEVEKLIIRSTGSLRRMVTAVEAGTPALQPGVVGAPR